MKTKIIPRNHYILVKPDEVSTKPNEFGLVMPSNIEQEQKAQGEVIAVSAEIQDVKKGDKVVYGAFAGEQLKFKENGKEVEYKLIHSDDVIAFIKE